MSVGIFINGQRPKSKKAVKEAITADPASVYLENTSAFDNKYDCTLADYAKGDLPATFDLRIDFVGPDPYTKRNFFGNIFIKADGKITVK